MIRSLLASRNSYGELRTVLEEHWRHHWEEPLCIRGIQGHEGKKVRLELLDRKLIGKKVLFHFCTMSGTPRTRTQSKKVV